MAVSDGIGQPSRFAREGGRNRFTARRATVLRVERIAPPIVREIGARH